MNKGAGIWPMVKAEEARDDAATISVCDREKRSLIDRKSVV